MATGTFNVDEAGQHGAFGVCWLRSHCISHLFASLPKTSNPSRVRISHPATLATQAQQLVSRPADNLTGGGLSPAASPGFREASSGADHSPLWATIDVVLMLQCKQMTRPTVCTVAPLVQRHRPVSALDAHRRRAASRVQQFSEPVTNTRAACEKPPPRVPLPARSHSEVLYLGWAPTPMTTLHRAVIRSLRLHLSASPTLLCTHQDPPSCEHLQNICRVLAFLSVGPRPRTDCDVAHLDLTNTFLGDGSDGWETTSRMTTSLFNSPMRKPTRQNIIVDELSAAT
jgi:hypothetical protein